MAIPCLGYPSRTAAVMAFRKEGLTTKQIADKIGISSGAVSALEFSASNYRQSSEGYGTGRSPSFLEQAVGTDPEDIARLRRHAAKRGIRAERLVRLIVEAVLADDMVDAVLDDVEEIRRAS